MGNHTVRYRAHAILAGTLAAWLLPASARAQQVGTIAPGVVYHAQETDHWCAAASIEMMMDCTAVRSGNAVLSAAGLNLAVGDGATTAFMSGLNPLPTIATGNVTSNFQAFIYGLQHGTNTVNGQTYFNPNVPFGSGADTPGMAASANLMDNPLVNGATGPAFGSHAYAAYNVSTAFQATRTIANTIAAYGVPAQVGIMSGAHSIIVDGVTSIGTPGYGQNYTITGVIVSDPWTGYAASQPAAKAAAGMGIGYNTWLRYGYDQVPGGVPMQLPNGNIVNARIPGWLAYFNPSPGQAGAYPAFYSPGYKFVVEPSGPEALDPGDSLNDGSLPAPPTELASEISGTTALSDAISDLSANTTLSGEVGFTGGSFDSSLSDAELFTMPGDTAGQQGDWLIPYDGSGGANDITGGVLIDARTGVIDEATWLAPGDTESSWSLSELQGWADDESTGLEPNDNDVAATPEPGALALLAGPLAAFGLRCRARKRRAAK